MTDLAAPAQSCISVQPVTHARAAGGTVTFDPNFMSSGYARKLYVLSNDGTAVWRTEAHVHPTPQICSLIDGAATLAYEDPSGEVVSVAVDVARYYWIGPNVPHQFELRGRAVLESFVPSGNLIKWLVDGRRPQKRVLTPDLFTRIATVAAARR